MFFKVNTEILRSNELNQVHEFEIFLHNFIISYNLLRDDVDILPLRSFFLSWMLMAVKLTLMA